MKLMIRVHEKLTASILLLLSIACKNTHLQHLDYHQPSGELQQERDWLKFPTAPYPVDHHTTTVSKPLEAKTYTSFHWQKAWPKMFPKFPIAL